MKVTEGDSLPIALRLLSAIERGEASVLSVMVDRRIEDAHVHTLLVVASEPLFAERQLEHEDEYLERLMLGLQERIDEIRKSR